MRNSGNLIPQSMRTKEEQRAVARMGGKASGEARRRKRTLRQCLKALKETVDADGLTQGEKWCIGLARRAEEGDVAAFRLIREVLNESEWMDGGGWPGLDGRGAE